MLMHTKQREDRTDDQRKEPMMMAKKMSVCRVKTREMPIQMSSNLSSASSSLLLTRLRHRNTTMQLQSVGEKEEAACAVQPDTGGLTG
jgi:hypothetical protein